MAKTVVIKAQGGPEVMEFEDRPLGAPGPGEILIRHHAIGLNFLDVYQRSGTYPMPMPLALGMEAAGVVEAVGEGVRHLKPGDRAAYASNPPGAYAEARVMPSAQVVRIPASLSFEAAAAVMLKGLTVEYLFHRTVPLQAGDTVLFHAAAGGVGLLACQWARSEGIRLIATAGSDEKCQLALDHGAEHAINYSDGAFAPKVRALTNGRGVDVVMDSVGAATFEGSLDCLRPVGMMISFGNSSGLVPPFPLGLLGAKGSLQITRPTVFTHIARTEDCQAMAEHVFAKLASGAVKIEVNQRWSLSEVREAHRALEARETRGASVLLP